MTGFLRSTKSPFPPAFSIAGLRFGWGDCAGIFLRNAYGGSTEGNLIKICFPLGDMVLFSRMVFYHFLCLVSMKKFLSFEKISLVCRSGNSPKYRIRYVPHSLYRMSGLRSLLSKHSSDWRVGWREIHAVLQ